jgi:hypothetical protein
VRSHEVLSLERRARGHWFIRCECLERIFEADPILAHRAHQDHVVAEYQAEELGVERQSA